MSSAELFYSLSINNFEENFFRITKMNDNPVYPCILSIRLGALT